MKRFLIVTLVLTVLVSIASTSCSTQEKRLPDSTQTEQLGKMPNTAATNFLPQSNNVEESHSISSGISQETPPPDVPPLLEGHSNEDFIKEALNGKKSSYSTLKKRLFNRSMFDFFGNEHYVAFHTTQEGGKIFLLIDVGSDYTDEAFENAISRWERIEKDDICILVPPDFNDAAITVFPKADMYIIHNCLFSRGDVLTESGTPSTIQL